MPLDSGDVTIAPDGTATGDGLAKLLYDALADEYDVLPGQLPAPGSPGSPTPGAQENLAKMARGIAEPIALGVNEGIEVTADPGEVLGTPLDAGAPGIAAPLTPAQLNAIVGSVTLTVLQSLIMVESAAGATLAAGQGQFYPRNSTPSAPYFRDDTNVDRKLLTAPAALSDMATIAIGRVLGLQVDAAGAAVPVPLTGAELAEIIRFSNRQTETVGGALDNYALDPLADCLSITANAVLSGLAMLVASSGRKVIVANGAAAGSGVTVDILHFSSLSTVGQRIVTPKAAMLRLYPGDAVEVQHGVTGNFWFVIAGAKPYWRANSVGIGASRSRGNFLNSATIGWTAADVPANDEATFQPGLLAVILAEIAAGATLTAGQAQFFARNDAPNNPYFRDDTNADRKIVTAPVPLSDMATQSEGTVLLRARGAGTGTPIAGTGAQLGSIVRLNAQIPDNVSSGVHFSYTGNGTVSFDASTNVINFNSVTLTIHGLPAPAEPGQIVYIRHIGAGAVTLVHNSASALSAAERFTLTDGNPVNGTLVLGSGTGGSRNAAFIYQGSRWQMLNNAMLPLIEAAAGPTLVGGQGVYWVKSDAPNNPYFRDDTNADRKLLTAPAALSDLATQAEATMIGRALGAGNGVPTALTQTQVSDMARLVTVTDVTLAPGQFDDYAVPAGTKHLRISFTGAGDVIFTGFALGASNSGGWFRIYKRGTTGTQRIIFRPNVASVASNQIVTSDVEDFIMDRFADAADVNYVGGRWQVIQQRISPHRISPVLNNLGLPLCIPVVLTAGVAGTPDDVTVWNANAPYPLEIIRTDVRITAASGGTIEGRSASGGLGSPLTETFSSATLGLAPIIASLASLATIALNGSLFIRRSDRAVAGKVYFWAVRT